MIEYNTLFVIMIIGHVIGKIMSGYVISKMHKHWNIPE
jgi:hypothetical protein